jgi:hypothetical protein
MSQPSTSHVSAQETLTQHAMLVVWGLYARRIGLVEALNQVELKQKTRDHRPQTKVLEFLVAILAGLPYLQDISRAAHPLDQDQMTAEAWDQPAWADYSGVSRTLQQLSESEVDALVAALNEVSQPFLEQEVELALAQSGCLFYDGDLTGRPVSRGSSYPNATFGFMGDAVNFGYQAAMVTFHSPTYGRLWLSSQLHPGDTVSVTQTQALVLAAESRTGQRPRRRTELIAERLARAEAEAQAVHERLDRSDDQFREARAKEKDARQQLAEYQQQVRQLTADYQAEGREVAAHCKLARARRKVDTYTARLPRCQQALVIAERRLARHEAQFLAASHLVAQLQKQLAQLVADNAANPTPVRAVFRLDGGFVSYENIAWLMEMGYDVYLKSRAAAVRDRLLAAVTPETVWQRVGGNAELTAWPATTVGDAFIYPLNVALARYRTGETTRHAVLLHYGQDEVMTDLKRWFNSYNGRQTIEAGIKEGKGVFQMHHLKVRAAPALRLQEQFACFAANFVRFAAHWLATEQTPTVLPTHSVKRLVQVGAHTSAWVCRQDDGWLLRFTEQSVYAGYILRFGNGPVQLPLLPPQKNFYFCHF